MLLMSVLYIASMPAGTLFPSVKWCQKLHFIALSVYVREFVPDNINVTKLYMQFSGSGIGASGSNKYAFEIHFYKEIETEKMRMITHENYIEFRIPKSESEEWPRITLRPQKLHWLSTDWSRTTFEDSEPETETKEAEVNNAQLDSLMKELYSGKESEIEEMKDTLEISTTKTYLICFNSLLWCLFTYIFIVTLRMLLVYQSEATTHLYPNIITTLMVAEGIQMLEVIHVVLRWSKGDPVSTVLQNMGRWIILFIVVIPHETAHDLPAFTMVCLTWSAIEVVRYPYYILQLINRQVHFMTWLRYTAWIPLYPTGIFSEIMTILPTLPEIKQKGKFDLLLPNKCNFSFHLSSVLFYFVWILAFLIAPRMFYHMYKQSFKKLGLNKKREKKQK